MKHVNSVSGDLTNSVGVMDDFAYFELLVSTMDVTTTIQAKITKVSVPSS